MQQSNQSIKGNKHVTNQEVTISNIHIYIYIKNAPIKMRPPLILQAQRERESGKIVKDKRENKL